jgi:uracil-DNA glycosylase family 4
VSTFVPDYGHKRARLVVVGEAPSHHEVARRQPFVGPSGWRMNEWMKAVRLERNDAYWTNVYPMQAPKNRIELVDKGALAHAATALHDRIAALDDPWLIVPTGNTALRALTGHGSIMKHRGSLYEYRDRHGRAIKVIPTIHAAATFRTPGWERRCRRDWERIAADVAFRELRLPHREHYIKPTLGDCYDFLDDAIGAGPDAVLALDIETPRTRSIEYVATKKGGSRKRVVKGPRRITVVGFSYEPGFSLTIPTTLEYWGDPETLAEAWSIIRALCALPCEKAMHNGYSFDAWWLLEEQQIRIRRARWDTLCMAHCHDPVDSHSLAYLASVDTREPYWKDDGKEDDKDVDEAFDIETYWRYNGKDACVTRELVDVHQQRLTRAGLGEVYQRHYVDLFSPLLRVGRHGLGVDDHRRARKRARLRADLLSIWDRLAEAAGERLEAKKELSGKKLAQYLYETLRLPKQLDRKTKRVTTKEIVVRRLMLRFPAKLAVAGQLILDSRRTRKLSEFLDEGVLDADRRIRCVYKLSPETGRLASAKNPRRTGRNLQNIDREIRSVYVPDPGCLFLEADLSQAESRVTNMLTGDPALMKIARDRAFDEHKFVASIIYGKPTVAIDKLERYMGKRTNHAGRYGMHGQTMSDALLKDGYTADPDECETYLERFLGRAPYTAVRTWQRAVRGLVLRDKRLVDSWGCLWDVRYERLGDDLYRRAYARIPQGEVARLLNQQGLIPLDWAIRKGRIKGAAINAQVHDSLLISVASPEAAYNVMILLKGKLEIPRDYWSPVTKETNGLAIPVEFKLGSTWACEIEFNTFPTFEEFTAAWHTLEPKIRKRSA